MVQRSSPPTPAAYGDQYLPAEVWKLARDLRTITDRELAPHGLTTQQAGVMLVARLLGGHGARQVAEALGIDTAGMTRFIDRLEGKGLIVRRSSPTDRRALVIELTPAGQELVPHLVAAFREAQERLLEGVDESELEGFRTTLRRLRHKVHTAGCERGDA